MNLVVGRVRDSSIMCVMGVVVCTFGAGCSRVDRWELAGEVTFAGQAITEGHISFDPVKPGTGGGFARIANGKYDTRHEGRNHPGGAHRVTISAYKGLKNPKNPDSDVLLAFPAYETETELPKRNSTMDFDVPADWRGAASASQKR